MVKLKKTLSSIDVFATGFGCLIGWGWIVAFGGMIEKAGVLGVFVGFLIGGILILIIGLTYSELSSSMPVTAGEYAFTLKALGAKHAFWCGSFMAMSYIALLMFEAVSLTLIFTTLWPSIFNTIPLYTIAGFKVYLPQVLLGILVSLMWCFINYMGTKVYGVLQTIMITLFIFIGFASASVSIFEGKIEYFIGNLWGELTPLKGIISVLALSGFFYIGFDMIPQAAEEYRGKSRKLALLIVGSIVIGTIWYLLVAVMIGFEIPHNELILYELPAAEAVGKVWGKLGFFVVLFLGIVGIITTYSASFFSSSRVLFGLARGKMFPESFAKLHPKYATPTLPIIIVTIASIIAVLLGKAAVMWFLDATSVFVALLYLYTTLSFIKLRKSQPNMNRPYKAPGGLVTGIIASIASLFLFLCLILPFSPGALVWPYEYAIFIIFLIIFMIVYIRMLPKLNKISLKEYLWIVLGEK